MGGRGCWELRKRGGEEGYLGMGTSKVACLQRGEMG